MTSSPALYDRLVRDLTDVYTGARVREPTQFRIPTASYTDPARFEAERQLLRRVPVVVAHVSQLKEPGSCLVQDQLGVPLTIVRKPDGQLGAFLNVCRHRGARLLADEGFCAVKKGFQCPYHGWSYDLEGKLLHVPKRELFPVLNEAQHRLVPVPVTERYGLVWVVASPEGEADFDRFLDPLEADLGHLGLEKHIVFRRGTMRRKANWKIVMEAFLDGYHVRILHKKTVAPYFKGHKSLSEVTGPHVRSMVGRTGFFDSVSSGEPIEDIRKIATPTYVFFPNTIFVVQPGFVSRATVYPTALDEIHWEHDLIIPEEPKSEKARAHWDLNYELIQNGVFAAEDLWVCEQIQRGLGSGANEHFTYGGEESAVRSWHRELVERLGFPGAAGPE